MKFKKNLILTLTFFFVLLWISNTTYALTSLKSDNSCFLTYNIIKNKNFLITINGNFINNNKNRIYDFRNVTLTLTQKDGKILKKSIFNDNKLRNISLPSGNFINWKFSILDKNLFKKLNLKNVIVYCNFNHLTEYDNSIKNGSHIFFNNSEIKLHSKIYINKNNDIYVPLEILNTITPILKIKKNNKSSILLKQYPILKSLAIHYNSSLYISIESLKTLLKQNNKIYCSIQKNAYTSITIYHE